MAKTSNLQTDDISKLIREIEKLRASKVIVYITSDNVQFPSMVALDTYKYFLTILNEFKNPSKITLLLNTKGGNLEAPWPIVNLIREYTQFFEVIILNEALSAGTLIALGADKIVMLPQSHLSPIDPSKNVDGRMIEIEDIMGYISFIKEKVGISEQSALAELTKELTKEITPTLLGSVNRAHSLIRRLAKQLLDLHKERLPEKQSKEIIQNLTQELYFHGHRINRKEAKEIIGFNDIVEFANNDLSKKGNSILEIVEEKLESNKVFDVKSIIGDEPSGRKEYTLPRAVIYSDKIKFEFKSKFELSRIPDPSGVEKFNANEIQQKWEQV
jgi:ClpP class serine protease